MCIIITKNLKIRKFTIDDIHTYFINNNEAEIKKYMPSHYVSNQDNAREEIECFISNYTNKKIEYHYAITKENVLIGHVGIGKTNINDSFNIYEFCCAMNKSNRGFGYATEATKAFASWCKNRFGFDKIYASADSENISSNKVLLNAGFTLSDIKINELNLYVFT